MKRAGWGRRPVATWRGPARDMRRPPSGGDTGEVEADDAGQDQADRYQLQGGDRVAEEGHADYRGTRGTDAGPYRVGGPDLEVAQGHRQQGEAQQSADREDDRRPQPRHPVTHLQRHRETGLEQAGHYERQPSHRVASFIVTAISTEPTRKTGGPRMEPGWRACRLGEMAGQEGQRRGFLRGEERAVVTAGREDGHGPGGEGARERLDARVEGIVVARRDPDRAAAQGGGVRDHVAGGERRGRREGT